MVRILCVFLMLLSFAGPVRATCCAKTGMTLQIVCTATEKVLWESLVKGGDVFMLSYTHSSDHTPVRDLFTISDDGEIVLIEESFLWYGAGLESNPDVGKTDFSGEWTRVYMHRHFPRFLLRVGEVANHVLTLHGKDVPLLSIAKGRESVWIRTVKSESSR